MQKSEDGDTLATSQLKEGMIAKLIVIPWLHIQIFTYHVVPSVYSGVGIMRLTGVVGQMVFLKQYKDHN